MRYRRSRSRFTPALLCALALALLLPADSWGKDGGLRCRELSFGVTLSPADATVYNVVGDLCSGSTYSHLYWDWPYQPETYSYMRRATAAGYAVLNLDRIGIGRSGHPPAAAVTIESNAYIVHQIVQALRGGDLTVPAFGRIRAARVVLVGHSLGSLIAIQEAATYGDVDGVMLTGISHTVTPALGDVQFLPASLDPHFAGRSIPDGYLTTVPGTRAVFYYLPSTDPQVLEIDEQTKETVTLGELETAFAALGLSPGVHVPAIVIVGDHDAAFCAPPTCSVSGSLAAEAAFFSPDACLETAAIPGAGHDLNLHVQAPLTYDVVLDWLDRRIGRDPRIPPPVPCQP
jgi:pimeloyl-ACP methyl ester carboxylesterase